MPSSVITQSIFPSAVPVKAPAIEFAGVEHGDHLMRGGGHHAADGVTFVKGGDTVGGVDTVGADKHQIGANSCSERSAIVPCIECVLCRTVPPHTTVVMSLFSAG